MMEFFKTIVEGVKQGTVAAWYDLQSYFIIMAVIVGIYLAVLLARKLFRCLFH